MKKLNDLFDPSKRSQKLGTFSQPRSLTSDTIRESYKVSADLEDVIQVALFLGQPLLLTGEPGTGKTRLAYYLASHFSEREDELPLIFNAKTTSVAQDLLYRYDSLRHFQHSGQTLTDREIEEKYISYEALGKASLESKPEGRHNRKRHILLIDEIDKAPRDFPNDLLDVLDLFEFEVPEINKVGNNKITGDTAYRPIIIITSNSEKNLPDAFLRRCVYYHIEFPDSKGLEGILESKHLSKFNKSDLQILIEEFSLVRGAVTQKKPATAELIAWAAVLHDCDIKAGEIKDLQNTNKKPKNLNELKSAYFTLVKSKTDLDRLKELRPQLFE